MPDPTPGCPADDRIRIVELVDPVSQRTAAELLRAVWNAPSTDQVINGPLLRALAHSGNYVTGACRGDRMVAAAVGFRGDDHLHAHLLGVDPALHGSGIGYAMKQHQRRWALDRGLARVCWTFDPLVRRNAYFNLMRLGAMVTRYLEDFYGAVDDGINTGDATDRLYVEWELAGDRARAAADGVRLEVDRSVLADRHSLLVATPDDIELLRGSEPATARRWRAEVRARLGGAMADGYQVVGLARTGHYVLRRLSSAGSPG